MTAELALCAATGAPASGWKSYSAYKDSGVEWIGEIPDTWNTIQIKRLSQVKRGASPRPIDDPKYFDDNGEFAWVRISDVSASNKYLENTTQKLSNVGASLSIKQYPGDIFLSIAGTVGKPIISKIKCCIHDGFVLFPNLKINPEFLYYIFSTGEPYYGLGKWGTQLNLNTETVGYISIPLPSNKLEINTIVKYLNDRTRKIDSLIEKKQKMIELLKEERTATINQAVTKGLNPDAPMKDSGIEWLGEVPKHWAVKKLKYLITLINEKNKNNSYSPDLKIAFENIESHTGKLINLNSETIFEGEAKPFIKGDVLFNKLRPYLVKVYRANTNGVCVGELLVFRSSESITSDFLYHRVLSEDFITKVNSSTYGAKMPRESWEFIGNLLIPFSPVEEQQKIVTFINSESTRTDFTISRIEKEVLLLQEYRTALISEVVTGKIDVRGE